MAKLNNIQDVFLNQARKENVPITIHLVNGFQLKGSIRSFDNFTVIIDAAGKQQLIYKHAISTITPARPVSINAEKADEDGEEKSDS